MKKFFLSSLIVDLYQILIEVSLWVFLAICLIGGWMTGGFLIGVLALLGGLIFEVIFVGAILILSDIRTIARKMEARQQPAETNSFG